MKENKIQILKEEIKKGTISYFSLDEEERIEIENSLKMEIEENKKIIQNIKDKIKNEKKKFKK